MKVKIFIGLSVLLASTIVHANSATATGEIRIIGGQVTGQATVYFGVSPAPTAKAACSTNNDYQFVIDPATDAGKALYSAILMAKSTNKKITVKGTGNCGFGQPMETVSYWFLLP